MPVVELVDLIKKLSVESGVGKLHQSHKKRTSNTWRAF